jgi:trypsin-like peptidase
VDVLRRRAGIILACLALSPQVVSRLMAQGGVANAGAVQPTASGSGAVADVPSVVPVLTPQEIAARTKEGIVLLETRTATGGQAQGTGFLIDTQGHVVTNFHVIRDACFIQARLGTQVGTSVEIVRTDPIQDVAVLRVDGLSGAPLNLGSTDALQPGSRVIAIGYPLGLGLTVSDGLYSETSNFGEGRSLMRIQTPIAPGSSGGPLFDDHGLVVGITTLGTRYFETGALVINYAVPIDVIRRIDLAGVSRKPIDTCHEFSAHVPEEEASADPKDDRVALQTFKKLADLIVDGVRGGALLKESDKAEGTQVGAQPSGSGRVGADDPDHAEPPQSSDVFDTYNYTLTWYSTSGDYKYNVYSVDPQLSIVTTFMAYVEIPTTTYRQKVKMKTEALGTCDGLYYRECLGHGGRVVKERAVRSNDTSSIWGLSYQEGRWRITRVLPPESASAFLSAVARSEREIIYRAIVTPPR